MTGKLCLRLVEHHFGRGKPEDDGLNRQQSARLQRIALQRHCQRENELDHQHPTGEKWIVNRRRIGFRIRNAMIVSLYHSGELPRKFWRKASAIV